MDQATIATPRTDDLVRASRLTGAVELREDPAAGDGNTLFGHFSAFDVWYEVNDWMEGNFMERVAPGAFKRTFRERAGQIKVLFDHGHDPSLGNKPLGVPAVLREDEIGPYYEVPLLDTSYNRDLIPGLRAGAYGASFRFRVTNERWVEPKKANDYNPKALPERTITDTDVYEFGPVTFPASPAASAGLRSMTGEFADRLLNDPLFVARFTERAGLKVAERLLSSLPTDGRSATPDPTADGLAPPADADATEDSAGGQQRCEDQDIRREWLATHLSPKEND